jgi:hypothetical protein
MKNKSIHAINAPSFQSKQIDMSCFKVRLTPCHTKIYMMTVLNFLLILCYLLSIFSPSVCSGGVANCSNEDDLYWINVFIEEIPDIESIREWHKTNSIQQDNVFNYLRQGISYRSRTHSSSSAESNLFDADGSNSPYSTWAKSHNYPLDEVSTFVHATENQQHSEMRYYEENHIDLPLAFPLPENSFSHHIQRTHHSYNTLPQMVPVTLIPIIPLPAQVEHHWVIFNGSPRKMYNCIDFAWNLSDVWAIFHRIGRDAPFVIIPYKQVTPTIVQSCHHVSAHMKIKLRRNYLLDALQNLTPFLQSFNLFIHILAIHVDFHRNSSCTLFIYFKDGIEPFQEQITKDISIILHDSMLII